jgi:hypothetical protein
VALIIVVSYITLLAYTQNEICCVVDQPVATGTTCSLLRWTVRNAYGRTFTTSGGTSNQRAELSGTLS